MTTALVMSALLIGGPATARMSAQTAPPKPTPPPAAQTQTPPKPAVTAPAPAPAVPFPADAKIAFVNFQLIASDSAMGKAATTEMNTLRDKKGAEIQSKNVMLKALQDKQSSTLPMSDQVKKQNQTDIDKLTMEIQYMTQMAQKEADDKNADLMNDFLAKVVPVVEAIAKERNLDAVLSFQDSGALYLRPGLDISADVIKRLDAQFKK